MKAFPTSKVCRDYFIRLSAGRSRLRREACNRASYANLAERELNNVAAFAGHVSGSLCLTLVTVSISPGTSVLAVSSYPVETLARPPKHISWPENRLVRWLHHIPHELRPEPLQLD